MDDIWDRVFLGTIERAVSVPGVVADLEPRDVCGFAEHLADLVEGTLKIKQSQKQEQSRHDISTTRGTSGAGRRGT